MTAAIVAKRCGDDVTIIEKNNILGKKLLLTGNGHCNYFNSDMNIDNFHSSEDVTKIINEKNLLKVKSFFDSIGLVPKVKDGYYYPYSNTSSSVQNSLLKEISILNINIINEEVIDIKKNNKFTIKTNNNTYTCDKVILSMGGASYKKCGSDGAGYELLRKLGHKIIPIKAGLVPLVTDENVADWKGIRTVVNAKLFVNGDFVCESTGEAQLTDYGISGICIMNLSRYIDKNNTLVLDFIKDIDNLYEYIDNRNNYLKNRTIIELLESIVNYKLLYFLFKRIKVSTSSCWNDLNNQDRMKIVSVLKEFKLNIVSTLDIDRGEVTVGGVSLDEIKDNCESTIIPNLFITGELLDIDGYCGGYNLTNAWITGILSGENHD